MKLVIVDINVMHLVFIQGSDSAFSLVRDSLVTGKPFSLAVVQGGKLRREYLRTKRYNGLLRRLLQAGRLKRFADNRVDAEEAALLKAAICESDDAHIIALARVSLARVLCSHDDALCRDFTNPKLISGPRGKVFRDKTHKHLLR